MKKIISIMFALVLVLSLSLVTAVPAMAGTDYYVATTGNDGNVGSQANPWLTIQHAIDQVSSTDTIIVSDGTYTGDLTVNTSNLTLESENGRDVTTIQGVDGWVITLNSGATGFTLGGTDGHGFTVLGHVTDSRVLLGTIGAPSGVTLSYNTFDTDSTNNQGTNMAIAVGAGGIANLTISHNIIDLYRGADFGNTGIYFDTGTISNLVVDDNTVYGRRGHAAWINFVVPSSQPGVAVDGAVISNNHVTNATIVMRMAGRTAVLNDIAITGNTFKRANIFIGPNSGTGLLVTNLSITCNTLIAHTRYVEDPFFEILGPTASNIDWDTLTVNYNNFNLPSSQWAVKNNVAGTTLNAENNWWGDVSGPTHSSNVGGTGALVSNNVDFDPFSYTPDPCKTKTLGFWKTHPGSTNAVYDLGTLVLGSESVTFAEVMEILKNAKAKNAYDMLAAQLIAAKLNVLHLTHLSIDSSSFVGPIDDADAWLSTEGYYYPNFPKPSKADKGTVNALKDALDTVNNTGCLCAVCST